MAFPAQFSMKKCHQAQRNGAWGAQRFCRWNPMEKPVKTWSFNCNLSRKPIIT